MLYIDQFVYSNNMRDVHPGEKFFFAITTMIICLMVKNPLIHLLVLGITLTFLIKKARIPGFVVGKMLLVPMGFLVLGVITIAFSWGPDQGEFLLSINLGSHYLGVTGAGLKTAGFIFLQALSSVSCLYFLALTVPMIDLIYVLKLLKVPSLVIELMMLVYRFIFVFVETAFQIYTAQSSRWGYSSFRRSIYSFGVLFANLWGKVFIKSQALMDSLQSRGYEGEIRVLHPSYKFSGKNMLIFVLVDTGLILVALAIPIS